VGPYRSVNPYSASKAAQEAIAISYWRTYNVPLIIVNLMNNFGEMQSPTKFPAIVQRKLRAASRSPVHASVGSHRFAVLHPLPQQRRRLPLPAQRRPRLRRTSTKRATVDKPDRYNIVGDKQITNVELVELIAANMGVEPNYVIEDSKVTRPGPRRPLRP
jgi:dTDP-D-glucose 4,6-dehydratase